jgi:ubiquitin thioesterase protein OTUB1
MKAYGYIHKIESDKSFVYFPALGLFGTMNYVNCNPKDIFEFEKIDDQLSYPKKCENLSQEWGKIIEVSSATLKVKLQNSINYTLPIHFFVKTIDELSIGQQVKTIKNSQGMIIYCEIVEPVQEPKEENDYPDTISKKHPLKSMKDSFKFNEKIKNLIKTLQNFYSSYRKIRGDGNCYYRAVGFAYIEYLSRGSCPTSKFIDYINTSSSEFRPVLKYLFEIKQRFGSAVDYCEELFSNRQNDLMLVKDIKDRVAKHLLNDPEKFKPFLTHSLEQEIQNVLEMGREAEGVPCSFMTEILGISIQNVLLDREGVVQNKILNDDSGNCIFLCLRTGHYDLLYTYEQDCEDFSKHPPNNSTNPELLILLLNHTKYLYEKLFTLSSNYNIRLGSYFPDSIPKIADFWQEFSKLSEKTSEAREISEKLLETVSEKNFISEVLGLCSYCLSSQSDFKLFCGHLMCKQDSFEGLKSSTKGLFLLNDFEGPPSECLVCKALLTTEDLKKSSIKTSNFTNLVV